MSGLAYGLSRGCNQETGQSCRHLKASFQELELEDLIPRWLSLLAGKLMHGIRVAHATSIPPEHMVHENKVEAVMSSMI